MTIKILFNLLTISSILLFPNMLQGQRDSISATRLSEVVISSYHINDSLMNAPASVGILTAAELQRNNNTDISMAMNMISGVQMQSATFNTNRISIRGIGARTPYGTNKIRAFFGNIPLTSGDSETTIEDLDIENLQQVEIIKGPLSSVYGAGLGGAILLTPGRSPAGNLASISTTHGSWGLMKTTARVSTASEKANLSVNYHNMKFDGWRENSSYQREGVTLSGELFKSEKSRLTYLGNYTYMKAFIPSSIDRETFENNPQEAAFTWKAAQGFEQYDSYMGGLSYEFDVSPSIKNTTSVFVNHKISNEPRPFDILRQNTTAYGARTQFAGRLKFTLPISYIIGAEYFRDGFSGQTLENLYQDNNGMGSVTGGQLTGTTQDRVFYNVFAQANVALAEKLDLRAGINLNRTNFELRTEFPADQSRTESYRYDAIWAPQVSLLYTPNRYTTLYASASRGFSLPAIEETLTPEGSINTGIKPETGYNLEVGAKMYLLNKKLYIESAVYRMLITDLLVARRIGDDQYVGVNAGQTLHQGIELSSRYNWQKLNWRIEPFAALSLGKYEFADFVSDDIDYSGNELAGVPSTKASAGLIVYWKQLFISGTYNFVGAVPLNDGNTAYSEQYAVTDIKTGFEFMAIPNLTFDVAAGINNLGNERYASMILPNATGFGNSQPRYYYPGLPINYYFQLRFRYLL
ncbi:MAG: TonB-dependent receptor [Flavobacterium sp.]|nr:TonB-dependent receptor [Flavobacterium sp.]